MFQHPEHLPAGSDPGAPRRSAVAPGGGNRLALALVVAGGALLALAIGARLHSATASRAGLEHFRQAKAGRAVAADLSTWQEKQPDHTLWDADRIAAYEKSLQVDIGLPLAVLRIARFGLEVPVWHGTDELTLNRGLGHIPGTAEPGSAGNSALAGHRDGFFRVLQGIAIGDEMELETLAGVERFTVTATWIVEPEAVWVLDPTPEASLTLITCYPFHFVGKAPTRFVVRASAAGSKPEASDEARGAGSADSANPVAVVPDEVARKSGALL